jgi:hypothetical protein
MTHIGIDPRFSIARTYEALKKAGIDHAEFEKELNACESPNHAVKICIKWREKATTMN